jgi:hypothetical protein
MCQNRGMARGWESKDIESQVESKKSVTDPQGKGPKSAEQIRREHERRDLQLSRTRITNDLQTATNPNHRKSLEAALTFLDKKIAELS